jgi:DNA-binding GntR family transcriptional regulator
MRIVRRLDFTEQERIDATYEQHSEILQLVLRRAYAESALLLRAHIQESQSEVRKITLHRLHEAHMAG